MIKCPFDEQGLCQVASLLARQPVPLNAETCNECNEQDSPQQVNKATCSLAIRHLLGKKIKVTDDLIICMKTPKDGVGTEFELLTIKFSKIPILGYFARLDIEKCGCADFKKSMNYLGYAEVLRKKEQFVSAILHGYLKQKPILKPFKPIVRKLIRWCLSKALLNHDKKVRPNGRPNASNPQIPTQLKVPRG